MRWIDHRYLIMINRLRFLEGIVCFRILRKSRCINDNKLCAPKALESSHIGCGFPGVSLPSLMLCCRRFFFFLISRERDTNRHQSWFYLLGLCSWSNHGCQPVLRGCVARWIFSRHEQKAQRFNVLDRL